MPKLQFPSPEQALCIFLIFAFIAYLSIPFLGYDNILEEIIEKIIQIWTGEKIDFSPEFLNNP